MLSALLPFLILAGSTSPSVADSIGVEVGPLYDVTWFKLVQAPAGDQSHCDTGIGQCPDIFGPRSIRGRDDLVRSHPWVRVALLSRPMLYELQASLRSNESVSLVYRVNVGYVLYSSSASLGAILVSFFHGAVPGMSGVPDAASPIMFRGSALGLGYRHQLQVSSWPRLFVQAQYDLMEFSSWYQEWEGGGTFRKPGYGGIGSVSFGAALPFGAR